METRLEYITPEIAKEFLAMNKNNRPLMPNHVERLAADMKAGNWKITHQGIAINCDGELLDGQHRLAAIILSGVSVLMLVTRGVPKESQIAMDDHARRTPAHALTIANGRRITDADVSVINSAVNGSKNSRRSLSKQELDKLLPIFDSAIAFVNEIMTTNQRGVTAAPVKAAISLAWFYEDLAKLKRFGEILVGREMPVGEHERSATLLREWLLRGGMITGTQRVEGFRKAQRAIAAFADQQPIKKLVGSSIHYPWPLVNNVRGNGSLFE